MKHHNLSYIFENQTEIDFFMNENVIAEAKYHADLNPRLKVLFDQFQAKDGKSKKRISS